MKNALFLFLLVASCLQAGPSLYDRNFYGLDWGRGGAYGPPADPADPDLQDPDNQYNRV